MNATDTFDHMKPVLDWASVGAVIAVLAGWLPPIAAALTIIYTLLRIWESETVKEWRGKK